MARFFDRNRARRGRQWLSAFLLALACAAGHAQPQGGSVELTPEQRARLQWQAGYVLHLLGNYERAIESFRASIADHPTAEGHTFLGWSLSHIGKTEEAIAQCKIAIELDPDFGNPYNDIGVYLIDMGRPEEAIPWLEKAIASKRYCCYQFPHYNLGRVRLTQGKVEEAKRSFERALEHDPQYLPALLGLEYIKRGGLKAL
ncbi:MAG: tetratricopeptide repeat protein [Betaproteobacteria bacterium]|nr:tetratricopeptide repeat protein [Betaproteobacteria bacterium]